MFGGVRDAAQSLMRELENPTISYGKYLLLAFVVASLPAWVIAELFNMVATSFGYSFAVEDKTTQLIDSLPWYIVNFVMPMVETLLLAGLIALIPMKRAHWIVGSICSVIFGVAHGFSNGALWIAGPAWAFFVYAMAYQAWRDLSFFRAFGAAGIPHVLNNALAALFFD